MADLQQANVTLLNELEQLKKQLQQALHDKLPVTLLSPLDLLLTVLQMPGDNEACGLCGRLPARVAAQLTDKATQTAGTTVEQDMNTELMSREDIDDWLGGLLATKLCLV